MNIIKLLKLGQEYMHICPKDKRLTTTFPELKIILLTQKAIKYMPPAIIIIFIWQYYMHAGLVIPSLTALFAFSLPIQGLLWLGKRAETKLPLTLLEWYNHLKGKLAENNIIAKRNITLQHSAPTFMELAQLLNLMKQHFGDYFDTDEYEKSL